MPRPWTCHDCGTTYGGPLLECPRCVAFTTTSETEDDMPKITVHGGPTNGSTEFSADWSEDPAATTPQADDAPAAQAPDEGSESSPGTSSSASSETDPASTSSSGPSDPLPAPAMELPSKPDPVESFTADPTDGSTPATGDPDKLPADEGYDARTVVELRGLLKDRGLPTTGSKADMVQRLADAEQVVAE